jgi:hypothetical protein
VAIQQIPAANVTQEVKVAKIVNIIGLVVALIVLLFVAYYVIAPDGTFKEYKRRANVYLNGQTTSPFGEYSSLSRDESE